MAGLPGVAFGDGELQAVRIGNVLAVERDDHIAGFDAGFFGRGAGHHIINERAVLAGQIKCSPGPASMSCG